ncbi:MAG: RloB family protein [Roseburia sp.]|nr:RloB family protein [Roseburia sp.]
MARVSNKYNARNKFYILTNGEQTEKNYFELLKAKRSIYDVKVEFDNSDPLGLVEYAIRNFKDANQVWCVFDIDSSYKDNRLVPALKKAEENSIKIAYSNVAFEVWLISHFERCDKELQVKDYAAIINAFIKDKGVTYSKNDKELLRKYFIPLYKNAVQNAKVVYQTRVKNFRAVCPNDRLPIWNWNSSTDVFKLVEALKLKD